MGNTELYISQMPQYTRLDVGIRFLRGHAFDWFKVTNQVEQIYENSPEEWFPSAQSTS